MSCHVMIGDLPRLRFRSLLSSGPITRIVSACDSGARAPHWPGRLAARACVRPSRACRVPASGSGGNHLLHASSRRCRRNRVPSSTHTRSCEHFKMDSKAQAVLLVMQGAGAPAGACRGDRLVRRCIARTPMSTCSRAGLLETV